MSTSAVVPSETPVSIAVSPELITFAVYTVETEIKNADNTVSKAVALKHTSSDKEITKSKEDGTFLFEQSVTAYRVGSLEGLTELVPDAEEAVNIINRGIQQKFNQKVKAFLTEVDAEGNPVFQQVEGAFDSKDWIQAETKRRNLSDTEKAMKFVNNLDPALKAMLAQMLAAQPTA